MKTVMKRTLIAMIMVLAVGLMVGTSAQAKSKKKNVLAVEVADCFDDTKQTSCWGTEVCPSDTRSKRTWLYEDVLGSNKIYLTVTYNGVNVTKKAKYKTSNKKVATVKKGKLIIKHMEKGFTMTVSYKGKKQKIKIKPYHKQHEWGDVDDWHYYDDSNCSGSPAQYVRCYKCGALKFISGNREAFAKEPPSYSCDGWVYVGDNIWETSDYHKYK